MKKEYSKKVTDTVEKQVDEVIDTIVDIVSESVAEKKEEEKVEVKERVEQEAVVVAQGGLNVRKKPSLSAPVIKVIADGSKVTILSDKDNSFYKVIASGAEGYCMKKFIKKV